jgi:hypothetical protein
MPPHIIVNVFVKQIQSDDVGVGGKVGAVGVGGSLCIIMVFHGLC